MADKTQNGHNISAVKKDVIAAAERIRQNKLDRTSCNDNIGAALADLEAKGIHKDAMRLAMKYVDMDEEKRQGFDVAYDICREAFGLPVNAQGDLFIKDDKKSSDA